MIPLVAKRSRSADRDGKAERVADRQDLGKGSADDGRRLRGWGCRWSKRTAGGIASINLLEIRDEIGAITGGEGLHQPMRLGGREVAGRGDEDRIDLEVCLAPQDIDRVRRAWIEGGIDGDPTPTARLPGIVRILPQDIERLLDAVDPKQGGAVVGALLAAGIRSGR